MLAYAILTQSSSLSRGGNYFRSKGFRHGRANRPKGGWETKGEKSVWNEVLVGIAAAGVMVAFFLLGALAGRGKRKELEAKVARLRQSVEALVCDDRPNAPLETVVWRVEHQKKGAEGDWERIAAIVRTLFPIGISVHFVKTWFGYQGRVGRALADDTQNLVVRIRQQLRDLSAVVRESIPDEAVTGGYDARRTSGELMLQACHALTPAPESEEAQ